MITAWNTRRAYTNAGQRIAARLIGSTVIFADVDRHVSGTFICTDEAITDRQLQSLVMWKYDNGEYQESALDGNYLHFRLVLAEIENYALNHAPTLDVARDPQTYPSQRRFDK